MTMQFHQWGLTLALGFLLVVGSAVTVAAQTSKDDRAGTIDLTIFAGVSAATGKEKDNTFSLKAKSDFPFGGRVAYNFTNHHAVEFTVANPLSFYGNYVYHFSPLKPKFVPYLKSKFVPYLTAGIGGGRYQVELDDPTGTPVNLNTTDSGLDRRATAFTVNFGGGVKYRLTDRFALRFDARDVVGRYKASFANVVGVPNGIVNGQEQLNDLQLTGGIVFTFGRK